MDDVKNAQASLRLDHLMDDYGVLAVLHGLRISLYHAIEPHQTQRAMIAAGIQTLIDVCLPHMPSAPGSRERRDTENETP